MSTRHHRSVLLVSVAVLLAVASAAHSGTITYDLSWRLGSPSSDSPSGVPRIQFVDEAVGVVRMTIDLTTLTSTEKVKEVYFNFDESHFSLTTSNLSYVDGTEAKSVKISNHRAVSGYKADGDGYYNGVLKYSTSGETFDAGATSVYDIACAGMDALAFYNFLSAPGGGQGTYAVAMHVQSVPPGGDSLWLADREGLATGWNSVAAVPLPSSFVLFSIGGSALGLFALKRRLNWPAPRP